MNNNYEQKEEEENEKEDFDSLELSEQKAIRFLLECTRYNQSKTNIISNWKDSFEASIVFAATDRLMIVPDLRDKLANKEGWTHAMLNVDIFYGKALHIAKFCHCNDLIHTFRAFDFLFVRLFGGAARPLTPSLFAACLLHPGRSFSYKDEQELGKAVWLQSVAGPEGRDTDDPVWYPTDVKPS